MRERTRAGTLCPWSPPDPRHGQAVPSATLETLRLAVWFDLDGPDGGQSRDLGRVSHEVPARDLVEYVAAGYEPDPAADVVFMLEVWEEGAISRVVREVQEIPRELADVLLDGRLFAELFKRDIRG